MATIITTNVVTSQEGKLIQYFTQVDLCFYTVGLGVAIRVWYMTCNCTVSCRDTGWSDSVMLPLLIYRGRI